MSVDEATKSKFAPQMSGQYRTVLQGLHRNLSPKTYFEIGTFGGATLKLASCASIAVDPHFQVTTDVVEKKPVCHFFQTTSDAFFRENNVTDIFKAPIDIAFLDGMHLYEFLFRDFINTEKHCRKNSIIILHDCLPMDDVMTRRKRSDSNEGSDYPGYWTGDVWKVVSILREFRPDLRMFATNAAPTGLIFLTNLDPTSSLLEDRYQEIVDKYRHTTLTEYGLERYWTEFKMIPTTSFASIEGVSEYFHL